MKTNHYLYNHKSLVITLLFVCYLSLSLMGQDKLAKLRSDISQYPDSSLLYLSVAKIYLFSNPDSSRFFLNNALSISNNTNDEWVKAETLKMLGVWYDIRSNYDSAIYYYQRSGDLFLEQGKQEGYADVLNNIGYTKSKIGDLEGAMNDYHKALDIYETEDAQLKVARGYQNIGNMLVSLGDDDEALGFFKKSMGICKELGDMDNQLRLLSSMAVVYKNKEMFETVIPIYDTLIYHWEQQKNIRGLSIAYYNLGLCYQAMGENDIAIGLFEKTFPLKKQMGDRASLAAIFVEYSRSFLKTGEYSKALANIDSSLMISEEFNDAFNRSIAMEIQAEIYIALGLFEKATESYTEYIVISKSLYFEDRAKKIEELNAKYETEKKDREIVELALARRNADLVLEKSNNQRNIFISVAVILAILIVTIWYLYQKNRKVSNILLDKNVKISSALEDREILLKEIHHRVKNNLQIVSSLLNLQAGSLSDGEAADAVKEGQSRVRSMALIHQKLYQDDNLKGVDVQDYLENLLNELLTAFGSQQQVNYNVDTDSIKLDIDTLIPLGLIINELATNSLKYAFSKAEKGVLEIRMREEDEKLSITITDNGCGISENEFTKANSFGWTMIKSLSRKLKAEIAMTSSNGTCVTLLASRYKMVL